MSLLLLFLLAAAFAVMQLLLGGTRLLFALPADALLGLAAGLSILRWKRARSVPDGFCVVSAVLFAAAIVARGVLSPVPYLAWPDIFSVAGSLVVYLLVACHLTDPARRLGLLGVLLVLAMAQLLVGARQFTGGDDFMLLRWDGSVLNFVRSAVYRGRASGLYICPNHLAGYLEVVGVLALAAALWARVRPWVRLLLGYGALVCLAGVLLTGSRGGMISVAVALGIVGVGSLIRSRATAPTAFGRVLLLGLLGGTLLTAGAGGVLLKSQFLKNRAATTFDNADIRLLLWPAAVKQFTLSPAAGTGSGTYLYYGRQFRDPRVQSDPIHVHNDYLELLGEYGLLGVGALGLLLASHLRAGGRDFRSLLGGPAGPSNAAALNLGSLAGVGALLAHSAVDFNLHIPANAMLLAFACAVLANPGRALRPGAEPSPAGTGVWRERWPRLLLPVVGAALLAAAWPRFPGELWAERARVAVRDEHWLEGARLARRGLELETRNPDLYFYLGEARFGPARAAASPAVSRSFYLASVEAYTEGVQRFPQDSRLLMRLGLAQSMAGREAEALETLAGAVRWDPQSARVRAAHAFGLRRAGRLEAAEAEYQFAVDLMADPRVVAGLEESQRARRAAKRLDDPLN